MPKSIKTKSVKAKARKKTPERTFPKKSPLQLDLLGDPSPKTQLRLDLPLGTSVTVTTGTTKSRPDLQNLAQSLGELDERSLHQTFLDAKLSTESLVRISKALNGAIYRKLHTNSAALRSIRQRASAKRMRR
jgi:hypothetical protein